jgi:hypothetical protein
MLRCPRVIGVGGFACVLYAVCLACLRWCSEATLGLRMQEAGVLASHKAQESRVSARSGALC